MKKVVVFGLMVLLLVFTVVAQSSDDTDAIDAFEKDKTPENLAKINNPNVGQFNKLENAQDKKTYLKDNYRDDFAGEYFKKETVDFSNSADRVIANKYFVKTNGKDSTKNINANPKAAGDYIKSVKGVKDFNFEASRKVQFVKGASGFQVINPPGPALSAMPLSLAKEYSIVALPQGGFDYITATASTKIIEEAGMTEVTLNEDGTFTFSSDDQLHPRTPIIYDPEGDSVATLVPEGMIITNGENSFFINPEETSGAVEIAYDELTGNYQVTHHRLETINKKNVDRTQSFNVNPDYAGKVSLKIDKAGDYFWETEMPTTIWREQPVLAETRAYVEEIRLTEKGSTAAMLFSQKEEAGFDRDFGQLVLQNAEADLRIKYEANKGNEYEPVTVGSKDSVIVEMDHLGPASESKKTQFLEEFAKRDQVETSLGNFIKDRGEVLSYVKDVDPQNVVFLNIPQEYDRSAPASLKAENHMQILSRAISDVAINTDYGEAKIQEADFMLEYSAGIMRPAAGIKNNLDSKVVFSSTYLSKADGTEQPLTFTYGVSDGANGALGETYMKVNRQELSEIAVLADDYTLGQKRPVTMPQTLKRDDLQQVSSLAISVTAIPDGYLCSITGCQGETKFSLEGEVEGFDGVAIVKEFATGDLESSETRAKIITGLGQRLRNGELTVINGENALHARDLDAYVTVSPSGSLRIAGDAALTTETENMFGKGEVSFLLNTDLETGKSSFIGGSESYTLTAADGTVTQITGMGTKATAQLDPKDYFSLKGIDFKTTGIAHVSADVLPGSVAVPVEIIETDFTVDVNYKVNAYGVEIVEYTLGADNEESEDYFLNLDSVGDIRKFDRIAEATADADLYFTQTGAAGKITTIASADEASFRIIEGEIQEVQGTFDFSKKDSLSETFVSTDAHLLRENVEGYEWTVKANSEVYVKKEGELVIEGSMETVAWLSEGFSRGEINVIPQGTYTDLTTDGYSIEGVGEVTIDYAEGKALVIREADGTATITRPTDHGIEKVVLDSFYLKDAIIPEGVSVLDGSDFTFIAEEFGFEGEALYSGNTVSGDVEVRGLALQVRDGEVYTAEAEQVDVKTTLGDTAVSINNLDVILEDGRIQSVQTTKVTGEVANQILDLDKVLVKKYGEGDFDYTISSKGIIGVRDVNKETIAEVNIDAVVVMDGLKKGTYSLKSPITLTPGSSDQYIGELKGTYEIGDTVITNVDGVVRAISINEKGRTEIFTVKASALNVNLPLGESLLDTPITADTVSANIRYDVAGEDTIFAMFTSPNAVFDPNQATITVRPDEQQVPTAIIDTGTDEGYIMSFALTDEGRVGFGKEGITSYAKGFTAALASNPDAATEDDTKKILRDSFTNFEELPVASRQRITDFFTDVIEKRQFAVIQGKEVGTDDTSLLVNDIVSTMQNPGDEVVLHTGVYVEEITAQYLPYKLIARVVIDEESNTGMIHFNARDQGLVPKVLGFATTIPKVIEPLEVPIDFVVDAGSLPVTLVQGAFSKLFSSSDTPSTTLGLGIKWVFFEDVEGNWEIKLVPKTPG